MGAQGPFARIRASIAGIFVGIALVVGAMVLQFWNEGRSFAREQLLDLAGRSLVEVAADRVHDDYDGRLVYLHGDARADTALHDPEFDQDADGLALRRRVEMFQWREHREKKNSSTRYRYDSDWEDERIDSDAFHEAGYDNPAAFPIDSETWRADDVHLGAFTLAEQTTAELDDWKPMAIDADRLPANLAVALRANGRYLTTSEDPARPKVGDIRVSFERIADGPVSLIAMQQAGVLVPWPQSDDEVVLVERGTRTPAALIQSAKDRNSALAWILRGVGFAGIWIGFGLLFAPILALTDWIPVAGRAARGLAALLGGIAAVLLSLLAIGSGFILHRPLWLLGIAAAIVAALVWWLRRRRRAPAVQPPPPPPAMPATPPPPPGA